MISSKNLQDMDLESLKAYCANLEQENAHLKGQNLSLQNTQNQLELVMQVSKQGFWYWHSDTDETFYSAEYYRILGYEPGEFVPSYEVWLSFVHPDDKPIIISLQHQFVRNEIQNYDVEFRMKAKDGSYRWYMTKSGKIIKENGGVMMLGLVIDITEHKDTRVALAEEKARLQLALEAADLGIWDWNLETGTYYHTPNYFSLLGYNEGEFSPNYEYWVESIHEEDKDTIVGLEMDCMVGKLEKYQFEYRMRTKQGQYKWFLCASKVLKKDENDQALRMIGIIKDIDQRKRVELALSESEEKFRLLIEHNAAAVCIFDTEQYYYVNPRFLRTFGYEEADIAHITPADIIHHDIEVEMTHSHKNTNTKTKSKHNRYELKAINKKGEAVWVDVTTLPIKYKGRQVNIATMYEVTKRKEFETEIREKNEELLASEEELRQNSEELLAMNESLEVAKTQLEQLLEAQKAINEKVEKKNWDLYKQKKELRHTLKRLQETQEHLIQSEKLASLGVLVAGIAHELNNPINYVSTSAEGLQYSLEDIKEVLDKYAAIDAQNVSQKIAEINKLKAKLDFDDLVNEVRVLLDNIQSGAKQTAEIVRGLRIFSRVEGGDFETVNIHEVLDQSLLILHNEYKYDIELEKTYSNVPLLVKALTSKLGQVFVNIIKNAIDAIKLNPEPQVKGKICINTHIAHIQDQDMIAIEVEDNGSGISEKTKKHIFEPFFTTKEVGKGTGLGLPISLGIIENFGGKIIVESNVGKGTKFTVYLPPV